jgi:hypothetical protein
MKPVPDQALAAEKKAHEETKARASYFEESLQQTAMELAAAEKKLKRLKSALMLAASRPTPHRGRWHQTPHVRDGCVGCVIEDALQEDGDE